jgi:hypothetical protein
MARVHNKPFPVPNPLINRSELVCWGCKKATGWTATGFKCPVYGDKKNDQFMIRVSRMCHFNRTDLGKKKGRVRVGQQKTKRNRR